MAINTIELMSGETTNTTGPVRPGQPGFKTFYACVAGTGAVAATISFYGTRADTAIDGVLLAIIALSGTTRTQDATAPSLAAYPNYYAVTTGISGTGASVRAEVFY